MHSRNPGYVAGDYWMVCDICGFDCRKSQMMITWDGKWVCSKDWEPRHPQDFVRGVPDNQAVPVARPDKEVITKRTTTLDDAKISGDTRIHVSDDIVPDGNTVGVELDDGIIQWFVSEYIYLVDSEGNYILTSDGEKIRLSHEYALNGILHNSAAVGNTVYVPINDSYRAVTADDL